MSVHYRSLTRSPARRKARDTIFSIEIKVLAAATRTTRFLADFLGDNRMTERPTDLSSLPTARQPRRSLLAARKFALMASVVAGLGVAGYGLGASNAPAGLFSTPAHAQVNNEVSKVAQPIGFADIVERVKPSVISVKVNINEKLAKDDSGNDEDSPFQPGSPMERFFRRFGGQDGFPGMRGNGHRQITGAGLRLLHLG